MKKLITFLFVVACCNCSAQMKSLYFGRSIDELDNIVDSILKAAPNLSVEEKQWAKNGHGVDIIFCDNQWEKQPQTVSLSLSFYNYKIYTCQIIGKHDVMFAIYRKYFGPVIDFDTYCAPLLTIPLENNKTLPISFCEERESYILRSNVPN